MQAVGPALVWLLVALAVLATTRTLVGVMAARRNRRRARGFFVLGFLCGATATAMVARGGRGRQALGVATRHVVAARRAGVLRSADRVAGRVLTALGDPRQRCVAGARRRGV
ncbi:hypothetical protein O6P37_28045 [Mycobacterium sp. CPCC 205372]|uniref:Uncharacterized protein n=1 Tax=Mycobacterium hippophais TaxID=3016340 RepID=A0ABT4Q1U2_9MYCO|nr:hypothetical protein [Mycobacterium hippophais]MCZ8382730.1 hypothetical protein [Mycobacterium hippophais]